MGVADDHSPSPSDCRHCGLFLDDPEALERALPGLTILSSAAGSTRGRAGICLARDTFQDPEPPCPEFRRRGDGQSKPTPASRPTSKM